MLTDPPPLVATAGGWQGQRGTWGDRQIERSADYHTGVQLVRAAAGRVAGRVVKVHCFITCARHGRQQLIEEREYSEHIDVFIVPRVKNWRGTGRATRPHAKAVCIGLCCPGSIGPAPAVTSRSQVHNGCRSDALTLSFGAPLLPVRGDSGTAALQG